MWTAITFVIACAALVVAVAAYWKNSITEHSVRLTLRTVLAQGKARTVPDEVVRDLLAAERQASRDEVMRDMLASERLAGR